MATEIRHPLRRIVVRLQVGKDRMSGSDDPLFLGLAGTGGREFRLLLAQGKSLRRGAEDRFVLGSPNDPQTNVALPELNDPTVPGIDAAGIARVYLRKALDPIPNVRGRGEFDDRLAIDEVEVELHAEGSAQPIRYVRRGPLWLGLVCGLWAALAREDRDE